MVAGDERQTGQAQQEAKVAPAKDNNNAQQEAKTKEDKKEKKVTPMQHGFAAVVSSAIATTLLQPLDVLKTRMQGMFQL